VTVDGTLIFTHNDTGGPRPRVYSTTAGGFLNFFTDGGALKNLKIVNEKWISDGTSNIAYVGGNVTLGAALDVVGNVAVDTNTLFVDSVGNKVGIGTTDPKTPLEVSQPDGVFNSMYIQKYLGEGSGNTSYILLVKNESGSTKRLSGKITGTRSQGSSFNSSFEAEIIASISTNQNKVGRMTFNYTGTANGLNARLVTVTYSSSVYIALELDVTIVNHGISGGLYFDGKTNVIDELQYITDLTTLSSITNFPTSTGDKTTFTGNVGIGTTNPGSALDVVGDVAISSNVTAANSKFSLDTNGTLKQDGNSNSNYIKLMKYFGNNASNWKIATGSYTGATYQWFSIRAKMTRLDRDVEIIQFNYLAHNGTSRVRDPIIIGGGTTHTQANEIKVYNKTGDSTYEIYLQIDDNTSVEVEISHRNSTIDDDYSTVTTGAIDETGLTKIYDSGTTADLRLKEGNVGIGTASPGSALDVVGDVAISSNLAVDTNTLFVDSVGNKVGIGVTNPDAKLHVNGNAIIGDIASVSGLTHQDAQLILGGTHNEGYNIDDKIKLLITGGDNDGGSPYYIMCQDENDYDQFFLKGGNTSSGTGGIMYFKGNVGIGADSPDVKLQVEGTSTSHRKLTKLATYNIFHHRDDLSFEHLITYSDSDGQAYYDNRDNFMYVQIPAFSGETLYTSTVSNYNASFFNAQFRDLSGNKPDIPQNTFYKVHVYSSLIDAYGNITTRGNVGIGTTNPGCPLHIKFTTNAARNSGTRFEDANSSNYWENWINNGDYFYFAYNGSDRGWIQGPSGPDATKMPNFTGQHMTFIKDIPFNRATECEGLIVSSDQNKYIKMNGGIEAGSNAITTNESLPVVSLSVTTKDKKCFGVISASEDPETRTVLYGTWGSVAEKEKGDTRVYINSVGEGAIWVTNINGSLESGDYITTSNVAGYGQKQDSEFLANYTVAKITMDCDFEPVTQPIQQIKKELEDVNYWVKTTYENVSEEEYSNLADESRRIVDDIYQEINKEESKTEQEGYELEVRQELMNVLDEHGQIQWEDDPSGATEKAYKIDTLMLMVWRRMKRTQSIRQRLLGVRTIAVNPPNQLR